MVWSLYAITPDDVESDRMLRMVAEALEAGITALQVRRKQAACRDLLKETSRVLELARPLGVPVLVNDRLDVALAAGADGVHLGQEDLPADRARAIGPPGMLIGISVENEREAREAERSGATYVAAGPVYATPSKRTGPPGGLDLIRTVRSAAKGPLVAIGGIGPEQVEEVFAAGADGIAVISAIFGGPAVGARVREFRRAIERARRKTSDK